MKSSYDKHLQFDLPYRYELASSRADDGSRSTTILCNTSINNSGEKVAEVNIKLSQQEGGIREDARNLRADFPAALLGTISEMGIGIGISSSTGYSSPGRNLVVQILMLIVAIEYADQTYILVGVKTGMERDEAENIEKLTRHMNRVLECLTLDGKRGNFARLTTSVVRRALKDGALKNENDPTAGIRSTRKRSAASKPAPAKSTPAKPAPAKPAPTRSAEPRRTDKPIRGEHELRKLIKQQKKAKRDAEEAVRLELKRRETARKEAIETAVLQNTVDRAEIEEIEERRRAEREALKDWERRESRLSARRSERADALAAQALDAALHSERERCRVLARREIPRQEDLREEMAQLETALGKLGAFAGSEKKAKRARIAEVKSERTLKEAMESCETAESRERAQLSARRAEFLSAAEREITLEPRPEQTAQAEERIPPVLEMLLAQKLRVGSWYGKDTLRAMLPEFEIGEELMDKVIDRLKRHNCIELDKTRDTVLCRYIQKLPKPTVKQKAFKREVAKILNDHACGYAIGDVLQYFDERITSSDVHAALSALVDEGTAKMEYDGPMPIFSGAQADAKTRFDPETTPVVPVDLSSIVSTPSAGTPPAESEPTVQLQTPHLEREEYQELILLLLSSGFDYSAKEVITVLNNAGFELLPARLNTMLRDLCAQGRMEETIRGRARYYSKL